MEGAPTTPLLPVVVAEERARAASRTPTLKVLLWWQTMSCAICGTGIFTQYLVDRGVKIPTAQCFMNYFFLSLLGVFRWHVWKRKRLQGSDDPFIHIEWWKYAILAFLDMEANFLLVKAYQYTAISSVQLLDCFTVPTVIVLAHFFLHRRFSRWQLAGIVVALVGVALLILSDADNHSDRSPRPVLGDFLVILGASFYGCANTGQEVFVKRFDVVEYLSMLGFFGALFGAIQAIIFETEALQAVPWAEPAVWGNLLGFLSCLLFLYVGTPLLLQESSAVTMNLSLLTADGLAILAAVFLFGSHLNWLFFVAFTVIVGGLVLYNTTALDGIGTTVLTAQNLE